MSELQGLLPWGLLVNLLLGPPSSLCTGEGTIYREVSETGQSMKIPAGP